MGVVTALRNMDSKSEAEDYERTHVHEVYQEIADHFSSTRHKPWPIVEAFLKKMPAGSVGLDLGCGNGKYLSVNPGIFVIASDRSENLVKIAAHYVSSSAIVADGLCVPHPLSRFDFVLSIAVVHHFSTRERRIEAIRTVLGALRPPNTGTEVDCGRALIFVWALEQKKSRRGWDEGDSQDVMVPWVRLGSQNEGHSTNPVTFQRYYHLYRSGELDEDIFCAGGTVLDSGYERDNWWAVAAQRLA